MVLGLHLHSVFTQTALIAYAVPLTAGLGADRLEKLLRKGIHVPCWLRRR